ncbi:hypothetical protein Sste5346_010346 [Sporothrix stenoceras]|uniref:Uncharacterized protein n=1 Tax=Sporothrix stenoceras TaxID=5173 RepID=A0ABR3YFY8_9PEZI
MPRLWSAAAGLISRISSPPPLPCPEPAYLDFSVIPDHLPTWLQTPSLIAAKIKHGNNISTSNPRSDGWDDFQNKAFWVQRCTIMMSFYCARLLILQKCIEHDRCAIVGMTNAPLPIQMKKIDMVLDFLRELEEIPFVYHQIKGEPSNEYAA